MTITDRRYTRFFVSEDAFAALGKDFCKVGKIKDISLGGLAFEYLDISHCQSDRITSISIFLSNNGFHLADLPCRIICDSPTRTIGHGALTTITKNKCSVQFLSLSDPQKYELDSFIKEHNVGLTP